MSDRLAPSAGLVSSGIALAAAFLSWTSEPFVSIGGGQLPNPIGALLATAALVAFALRRYEKVDRDTGSVIAGSASLAVLLFAVLRLLLADSSVDAGLGIAAAAALAALTAAYLDREAVSSGQIVRQVSDGGAMFLTGIAGLFTGSLLGIVGLQFLDVSSVEQIVVLTILFSVGLGVVAFAYLGMVNVSLDYIDFYAPTKRDIGYMVGGIIAIFALLMLLSAIVQATGLPSAENDVVQQAKQGNVDILLVLVPLSWLVIGPGEELLFRNIIQKHLYENFSRSGAVIVACAIFTLMHIPAYFTTNPVAVASTLVRLFFLSLILGVSYSQTDNLTVPTVIHGTFNAIQFAVVYVMLKGGAQELFLANALTLGLP